MSEKPLEITVVITTFNRKDLLRRSISSVLNQTQPPQQIIVIDDGSTDGTGQIIEHEFPDIEYIYEQNSGISTARNTGIKAATAPWIAFLDSDDVWMPEKLSEQIIALRQSPTYRICHTDEIWIRRGRRVNPKEKHLKSGGSIYERCLPLCVISPSSVVIDKGLFERYGLFDESMPACEDYDMWLRICSQQPVLYIEKKLIIKYGGHADQLSHRYWGMDRFRIYSMEKILSSDLLSVEQYAATLKELEKKLKIYISGARKRDKNSEVKTFSEKLKRIRAQLTNGSSELFLNRGTTHE